MEFSPFTDKAFWPAAGWTILYKIKLSYAVVTILKLFTEKDVATLACWVIKRTRLILAMCCCGTLPRSFSNLGFPFPSLLRAMGYSGLQGVFPLQQNLISYFGEIVIHLQTFSYCYKLFLVLDPGDRRTNQLWFWLWKSVQFKGARWWKGNADRHEKDYRVTAVGDVDHWGRIVNSKGWGDQTMIFKMNGHLYIYGGLIAHQVRFLGVWERWF